MSRLPDCLQRAVATGRISDRVAGRIAGRVSDLLAKGLPDGQAMARAARELAAETAETQRQTALRILKAAETEAAARSHPSGMRWGVMALLARDLTGKATYTNVEQRARAIRGLAHAGLVDVLDRFRTTWLGFRQDQAGIEGFVRALYGEAVPDQTLPALARAWTDTTDRVLDRYIAAGGSKATRRQDWRMPQVWEPAKLRAEGREAFLRWMEDQHAAGRLRVRDFDTGQEVSPLRRAEIFSQTYERVASGGLSDLTPGAAGGGGALANRRAETRAFEWTSADAYLGFNERFGAGNRNLFDLLNGHIDGMARDTAMLEVLGPNPEWTVRYLRDLAMQAAANPQAAADAAWRIDSLWHWVSGTANTPVHEAGATFMREARAFITAARLGGAVLSAVSDFATMRQVQAWNGLPAVGWMSDYLRLLNPAAAEDRRTAVRAGLLAEAWAQRAAGAMRNQADIVGTGIGSRVADTVLRASGLNAHTQAARWAIGMETLGVLADQAGRQIDELPPFLRAALGRYGIGAAEWDILRARGVVQMGGSTFLSPEMVTRSAPAGAERAHLEAATRLLEFVQTEGRFAVPEHGALERSYMLGQTRPGTWTGEFLRSAMQFKTFPVTIMMMHLGRALNQEGGNRATYLASFAIGTTLMGALALQLKATAAGRDPRDMTDHRFWGAAFAQGGGAGIVGDFLFTAVNRADQSFYMNMVGGPAGGLVDDVARIAGLNVTALMDGERERAIGADLSRFLRNNAPGTTLWYTRLAMDRLIWDRLQWWADPDAGRRFRAQERRAMRDTGQEFWWAPGEDAPRRGPDVGAMMEGRR